MQKKGFTLIELLIVIGLLAALAAVLLPSLMGNRTDAVANICDYNQAGTLRTLKQYESMTSGMMPNGLHTGLNADGTAPLTTMPSALLTNMLKTSPVALSAEEVSALQSVGMTKLSYGNAGDNTTGSDDEKMGYKVLQGGGLATAEVDGTWLDDAGKQYSFNGKPYDVLMNEGYTKIIPLFISPTTDWKASSSVGWVKGFEVGMDVPGACPVPEADFAYYMAYVGIKPTSADLKIVTTGAAPNLVVANTTAGELDDLKTLIEGESAPTGWTLPTASDWEDDAATDPTSSVATAEYDDGNGNTGHATLLITYKTIPSAKLLGTSCPECGITNP